MAGCPVSAHQLPLSLLRGCLHLGPTPAGIEELGEATPPLSRKGHSPVIWN